MAGDLFAAPARRIARVALPVPVDRLFDYAVPQALARGPLVGRRVQVEAGGRRLVGIVAEEAEASPRSSLRAVEAVVDATPVLPPTLLRVVADEARDVLCPIGLALAAALPPGSSPRAERALAATERGREALRQGLVRGTDRSVLEALATRPLTRAALLRRFPDAGASVLGLERDRLLRPTLVERGPRVRAAAERVASLPPDLPVEEVCRGPLRRAPRQAALLREIARRGPTPVRTLRAAAPLRALEARGLVQVEERAVALEGGAGLLEPARELELTAEQRAACREIGDAVRGRRSETFLLQGVTGSGKTEVYLRAVAEALACGRQALVLVPEITLTHQILGRLRARFGDRLAVLHSGLRPTERLAQWERLHRGETPIAVGARSALFAPTADLGVIVVDEEHDTAYKNEEGFRYHARSLASRRARADGCPLVLGSATPALETRHAAEAGRARHLRLHHRIGSRPLPAVALVDLARERALLPRGRKLIVSAPLRRALRQTLEDGGQSILFLNRRGFSTQIACFDCQHVARCAHCDIALTYHAAEERLRCHYCDYHLPPPAVCPACGSPATALLGVGTERLEEEVRVLFPDARVGRLDRDTAARRGATEALLGRLRDGDLDVLVGTQMVAKGHDFPGVRLVGVVNADLGLHFPDFRAAERTFQLLTQVAGRAGRGTSPGRVVIQTFAPDHYAIRPVVNHDYERFYAEECTHRAALGYPPFGCLARVLVGGPDEEATREAAESLARAAHAAAGAEDPVEVLGPAPAPIARLRGRHRFQLLLKHARRAAVQQVACSLAEAVAALRTPLRASVDVHPLDML